MSNNKQRIVPHLWFNDEAEEATSFYTSIFPNSMITQTTILNETPSGNVKLMSFQLYGQKFISINGGPHFIFNSSISFLVHFNQNKNKHALEQMEAIWNKLSDNGKVLIPFDTYPFSKKYGWIQDKYGLSWQLILTDLNEEAWSTIIPSFMYSGSQYDKAEEAIHYYLSIFQDTKLGNISRYPKGMEPDQPGKIRFADFCLENQWFTAMGSARAKELQFNEAISFIVYCDNQDEIDYYWNKLSANPKAERCGWLKDKYGVSWQIIPKEMVEMMENSTKEQKNRIQQAILPMKKIDLEKLRHAYHA